MRTHEFELGVAPLVCTAWLFEVNPFTPASCRSRTRVRPRICGTSFGCCVHRRIDSRQPAVVAAAKRMKWEAELPSS